MGRLLNIVNKLYKRTKRDYISRMIDNKVECMIEARKYDNDFLETV